MKTITAVTINKPSVTSIEIQYKNYLTSLKEKQENLETIRQNPMEYNKLGELTFKFVKNVVLKSSHNKSNISSTTLEYDEVVNMVTTKVIRKTDEVLAVSEKGMIPFVMTIASRETSDICKKWRRQYLKKKDKMDEDEEGTDQMSENEGKKSGNDKEERESRFVDFDEVKWGTLRDDYNLEEDCMRNEEKLDRLQKVLPIYDELSRMNAFDVLSFVVTKGILTDKGGGIVRARILAKKMDGLLKKADEKNINKAKVAEKIYRYFFLHAADEIGISYEKYFGDFSDQNLPDYDSVEELAKKITKGASRCKCKLLKRFDLVDVA